MVQRWIDRGGAITGSRYEDLPSLAKTALAQNDLEPGPGCASESLFLSNQRYMEIRLYALPRR